MILSLITSLMGTVEQGLKLANTKLTRKYLDESTKLKLELQDLLERQYNDQDDELVVKTYARLKIWSDGSKIAIELAKSEGT